MVQQEQLTCPKPLSYVPSLLWCLAVYAGVSGTWSMFQWSSTLMPKEFVSAVVQEDQHIYLAVYARVSGI